MANFRTHLVVAAGVSGVLSSGLLVVGVAKPEAVVSFFALGTIGGLLPDIDSDASIPIRLAFTFLALVGAFMTMFRYAHYSIIEMMIIWLTTYITIRYVFFSLFAELTVHRGVIHSIPAAFLACFLATWIATHFIQISALNAWIAGAFVGIGFIVHLALDEIYSVDLMGMTVKRSFGTALCLGKFHNNRAILMTFALYLATGAAFYYLTPDYQPFIQKFSDTDLYIEFSQRLLPTDSWFKDF